MVNRNIFIAIGSVMVAVFGFFLLSPDAAAVISGDDRFDVTCDIELFNALGSDPEITDTTCSSSGAGLASCSGIGAFGIGTGIISDEATLRMSIGGNFKEKNVELTEALFASSTETVEMTVGCVKPGSKSVDFRLASPDGEVFDTASKSVVIG